MSTATADGRRARGQRTRDAVLTAAVSLASVDGLAGLSFGQLADELGVSKSGLFAHWPDKEALQLAVVEHAREQWITRISAPALRAPRGSRRLLALHEARIAFYCNGVLPGGCFFHAAYSDFDDSTGPVKDRLSEIKKEWFAFVESLAAAAVKHGDLRADTDPALLAFEIDALGEAVIAHSRLVHERPAYEFSCRAVVQRLRALSTDPTILPGE